MNKSKFKKRSGQKMNIILGEKSCKINQKICTFFFFPRTLPYCHKTDFQQRKTLFKPLSFVIFSSILVFQEAVLNFYFEKTVDRPAFLFLLKTKYSLKNCYTLTVWYHSHMWRLSGELTEWKKKKKKRKKPFVRLEISVLMTEEVSCQERERWKQFPAMESKRADNEKDYQ